MSGGHNALRRRLLGDPSVRTGVAMLSLALLTAAGAGWLFGEDPFAMVGRPFLWPGTDPRHPLGTDMFGRDILTGLAHGARVSLLVGLTAAGLSIGLGVAIGVTAGYFGGLVDHALMRLTEMFQTMPPLILVVALVAVLQPSIGSIVLAIGLTSWTQSARLVRAETLRVRDSEFVQAARVMGMGHGHIILAHVLHNVLTPVIVTGSILVGTAILTEVALSFLGLGDPNVMSWGSMIGAGRQVLRTAWYMTALPGLAIVLTVVAFTAIGNGLGHVLNPRGEAPR
ncbi:ABC transporter permease [Paracraurococcus lichenis]|uniref:ABC transporter permease n=1 Tax=Paracraurococcus lichenis TaxID=3064888 RepID=A0ABT9E5V8_9PROT|nr:ABC transporter permease [Paracraurococcus sp. LOR1-02]MDO9711455.1 ABC transporter permease [Paracraurococcus sp. LOR1-02]